MFNTKRSAPAEVLLNVDFHQFLIFVREAADDQVLLLQLSDELLLVVQLVSQAADLLLMSFTMGVDLLLHRFLNTDRPFAGLLTNT